jgi:8-oxo-dGTP pyrophosphatase MutT (NUDIX family)
MQTPSWRDNSTRGDRDGPHDDPIPMKTSIGIILCRRNAGTGRPEALLVHKRYTYAFAEFIHGRYARGRAGSDVALRHVSVLLADMTREELFDILSLNFEQMWYRVWLTRENWELYRRKYDKFHSTFMRDDGGASLRRAVMQVRGTGVLLWEVPKGRRLNPREADMLCAVRELGEETGIEKSEYRFLPGIKRRVSYVSAGTRYACTYYVAIANPRLTAAAGPDGSKPTLRDLNLMAEVSEIRWHDIERIRLIAGAQSHLEALVVPAFRLMKKYLRGRWASRRPAERLSRSPVVAAVGQEYYSSGLEYYATSQEVLGAPSRACQPGAPSRACQPGAPSQEQHDPPDEPGEWIPARGKRTRATGPK